VGEQNDMLTYAALL